jgi:hypothetical protein
VQVLRLSLIRSDAGRACALAQTSLWLVPIPGVEVTGPVWWFFPGTSASDDGASLVAVSDRVQLTKAVFAQKTA